MNPYDIRSMTVSELEALIVSMKQPAYRGQQIFSWIHRRGAENFDAMTDLPSSLRQCLAETCRFSSFAQAGKEASTAEDATKYLFVLEKNTIIESVLMQHTHGATLCVSTQSGCRMGCRFCASTVGGLDRNLTAGEMCTQVYQVRQDAGLRIDNLVLMGCGEPLDNYDASLRFIELISHPKGQNIGRRHITLSTCGLIPMIDRLAKLKLPITLAVSLHAPDDETRKQLMPVARRYSVQETITACGRYAELTHRRVTFEYALIDGVNDTDRHAKALSLLLKDLLCHVNLIPLNASSGPFRPSRRVEAFERLLIIKGVPVTVRHSLGGDIQAACGQLRRRCMEEKS